ncbi:MAG: asparagine synthase (glutamine-hydrolyzing) [Bacteroidales bacterium]
MCGITGIYSFSYVSDEYIHGVSSALSRINHRGPDFQSVFSDTTACFGHARLSVIDTSKDANQPFTDVSGRYTIVYNGEFYNYRDFYAELRSDGVSFVSASDTEVLLYLYIKYKEACLEKISGFFAFAIYDSYKKSVFIARDRVGIKPLYYTQQDDFIGFSSELSALMVFPFPKEVNYQALSSYLQLQYIPAPDSIVNNVYKLAPGEYITITKDSVCTKKYYTIPQYNEENHFTGSYTDAQKLLRKKLDTSVGERLISDVPLGTFLSGGIDSSVISTIAASHVSQLQTFSVGFTDNPYFDETTYAELVAQKIHSRHTVIPVSTQDFEENMFSVLDSFDEPFADSSAIAVSILSKYVKPHVTVALSGDGADELFAGYNKHKAHFLLHKYPRVSALLSHFLPAFRMFSSSRNSKTGNVVRQLIRFAEAARFSPQERYVLWCSIQSQQEVKQFILPYRYEENDMSQYTAHFRGSGIQDVLYADQHLVLPHDMLTKVDRMSMLHSLEVRTPFLDHAVVQFANSLPEEYKIDNNLTKKVLQDAYRLDLPEELYNRPKKGFEVPLHSWCCTVLQPVINNLLSHSYIQEQGIFSNSEVQLLRSKLFSQNPGDSAAKIWALIVFQTWWKKYMTDV